MTTVTTREFRANQSKYLDMANRGENVILTSPRKGKFHIIPVVVDVPKPKERDYEPLVMTPELAKEIEEAREEMRRGEVLMFDSAADAQRWMDSL